MSIKTVMPRLRRVGMYALYLFLVTFSLAEIATRFATRLDQYGMLHIGRIVLLPYRPDAQRLAASFEQAPTSTYIARDDLLGWSIVPNGKAAAYVSNSQAIRAEPNKVYSPDPAKNVVRIITLGDSFTHCDEVANDQTWQHYLEKRHDHWEVLNLGVPGYGVDQAFLRWRYQGSKFKAQVVMLGIWPEDICRDLNVFRYYMVPDMVALSKPRFKLKDRSLELINSPTAHGAALIKALTNPESSPLVVEDYWYDPALSADRFFYKSRVLRIAATLEAYRTRQKARNRIYAGDDPAGIELAIAIATAFDREVKASGAIPIILILPMRTLVEMYPQEDSFPLVRELKQHGLRVIDTGPYMLRMATERTHDDIFPRRDHLPPLGNEVLCEEIDRALNAIMKSEGMPGSSK